MAARRVKTDYKDFGFQHREHGPAKNRTKDYRVRRVRRIYKRGVADWIERKQSKHRKQGWRGLIGQHNLSTKSRGRKKSKVVQ